MSAFIRRNLLVLVILLATVLAAITPTTGVAMRHLGLVPVVLTFIFLCQGASIDKGALAHTRAYLPAIVYGFIISQLVAPLLGLVVARFLLGWSGDFLVGFILICVMSPTIVSGTVIATQAGADRTTCVLLTIFLSIFAVVTIPFHLGWMLDEHVAFDRTGLLLKLLGLVLLPAVVGYLLRRSYPQAMGRLTEVYRVAPVLGMGAVFFIGISEQVDRLLAIDALSLVTIIVPSITVHGVVLAVGYAGALALSIAKNRARAVAIVCSQKTIPLALAIWSTEFSMDYPLALLPPLIFHFSQIYFDSVIVAMWRRRDIREAATSLSS